MASSFASIGENPESYSIWTHSRDPLGGHLRPIATFEIEPSDIPRRKRRSSIYPWIIVVMLLAIAALLAIFMLMFKSSLIVLEKSEVIKAPNADEDRSETIPLKSSEGDPEPSETTADEPGEGFLQRLEESLKKKLNDPSVQERLLALSRAGIANGVNSIAEPAEEPAKEELLKLLAAYVIGHEMPQALLKLLAAYTIKQAEGDHEAELVECMKREFAWKFNEDWNKYRPLVQVHSLDKDSLQIFKFIAADIKSQSRDVANACVRFAK